MAGPAYQTTTKDGRKGFGLSAILRAMKGIGNAAWNYLGVKKAIIREAGYDGILETGEPVERVVDSFGGSGLVSQVVKRGHPGSRRLVNDLNPEVVNLHTQIRDNPDAVIAEAGRVFSSFREAVLAPGYDADTQSIAGINFANGYKFSDTPAGRAAAFSLRFSGRTGGALGKGEPTAEAVPEGIKWAELAANPRLSKTSIEALQADHAENVRSHSRDLQGAEITNKDARQVLSEVKEGDFVPVDPPYYPKDATEGEAAEVLKYGYGDDLATLEGAIGFIKGAVIPAAKRGARIAYTNYWNDGVAKIFTDAGFTVRKVARPGQHGKVVHEIVAFNPRGAEVRESSGAPLRNDVAPAGDAGPDAGRSAAPAPVVSGTGPVQAPAGAPAVRTSAGFRDAGTRARVESALSGIPGTKLDLDGAQPAVVLANGERLPIVTTADALNPSAWLASRLGVLSPVELVREAQKHLNSIPKIWKGQTVGKKVVPPTAQDVVNGWSEVSAESRAKLMERTTPGVSIRFGNTDADPVAMLIVRETLLGKADPNGLPRVGGEEVLHALWRGHLTVGERAAVMAYASKHPTYGKRTGGAKGDAQREMELGTQVLLDAAAARGKEVRDSANAAQVKGLQGPIAKILDKMSAFLGRTAGALGRAMGFKQRLPGVEGRLGPELFNVIEGLRTGETAARPFKRGAEAPLPDDAYATNIPIEEQAPATRQGIAWRRATRTFRDTLGLDAPVKIEDAQAHADELLSDPVALDTLARSVQRGHLPVDGTKLMGAVLALQQGQRGVALSSRAEGDVDSALRASKLMLLEQRLGTSAGRILNALRGDHIDTAVGVEDLLNNKLRQIGSYRWQRRLRQAEAKDGVDGARRVQKQWLEAQNAVVKAIKGKTGFDLNDRKAYEALADDLYATNVIHDAMEREMPRTIAERASDWWRDTSLGGLTAEIVRSNILTVASPVPQAATAVMFAAEASLRPLAAKVLGALRRDLPADVVDAFGGVDAAVSSLKENFVNSARLAIESSLYGGSLGYRKLAGDFRGDTAETETQMSEGGRARIPAGIRHLIGPGAEGVRIMDEFVWAQVFHSKQAYMSARKQRAGDARDIEAIKGDEDVIDASRKEADDWTLRGDYEGMLGGFFQGGSKLRQVQYRSESGEMRTHLGIIGFGMFPIFKSYVKALQRALSIANLPGNAHSVYKALRKADPESAALKEISVEELDAQQFEAGVQGAARLMLGAVLGTIGLMGGETTSTDDTGSKAIGSEQVVRSTAKPTGTLGGMPSTRLSPWFEATQLGAIARETISSGKRSGGWVGAEAAYSALSDTLINRPLLSGVPIPRTDAETGAKRGTMQQLAKQYSDLMAVGRPYVGAYRSWNETTARSVPQGAGLDDWMERNYKLDRAGRPSWLGESRPTGGFARKMMLGGAAVPTPREEAVATHIVRVNERLIAAGERPYWFPPVDRVISAKNKTRYTDAEYSAIRRINGAIFLDAYSRLPKSGSPAERMDALRGAWLNSRAQAESLLQPQVMRRLAGR